MNSRREFLKTVMVGGTLLGLNSTPLKAMTDGELVKITILHTNDTHSHVEPFPYNDPNFPGLGGFARRAAMIKKIRSQEKNVLLFDAGDVFQGTPYFNMYGGEVEFKLMSEMGYDAMNIGNHEFDKGLENLAIQMDRATFPFLSANYDFSDTVLDGKIQPYKIFNVDGIKIGVFGLGIELHGLVGSKEYQKTIYNNPFIKAAETTYLLKNEQNCDLIICISHLGFGSKDKAPCDVDLAKQSKNIDLIIGGHSHTFIDQPYVFRNSDNKEVIICQVGWAGVKLGRIDYYLMKRAGVKVADAWTMKVEKNNC